MDSFVSFTFFNPIVLAHTTFSKHCNKNKNKTKNMDFPGGLVIKNLPANAGDTGSIPGPRRFHLPVCPRACAPQQEATAMKSTCTTTRE